MRPRARNDERAPSLFIGALFKWLNRRSQKRSFNWENFGQKRARCPSAGPRVSYAPEARGDARSRRCESRKGAVAHALLIGPVVVDDLVERGQMLSRRGVRKAAHQLSNVGGICVEQFSDAQPAPPRLGRGEWTQRRQPLFRSHQGFAKADRLPRGLIGRRRVHHEVPHLALHSRLALAVQIDVDHFGKRAPR